MDLMEVLAELKPVDRRVPSLLGSFQPIGVVIHHTVSAEGSGAIPSLKTVQDGRAATAKHKRLPGPLCNVLIGRDASVHVITDGRANDTGTGDPHVLDAFRAKQPLPKPDDQDPEKFPNGHWIGGSKFFYDIEVENNGQGEKYPPAQIEATGRVAAAICRANGFAADRVLLHKEWTCRKIDWSAMSGDETRALVARFLEEDDMPTADEVADAVMSRLNKEGTANGLLSFGETVQHSLNVGRICINKLDQLLARQGELDIEALAGALAGELGPDLARQLGETLVINNSPT